MKAVALGRFKVEVPLNGAGVRAATGPPAAIFCLEDNTRSEGRAQD